MEEEKIEQYYRDNGKQIVDMLFDAKLFHDKVTRDDLLALEDLISYLFQSHAQSQKRAIEFTLKWKDKLEQLTNQQ
jgi:hypothetical protein